MDIKKKKKGIPINRDFFIRYECLRKVVVKSLDRLSFAYIFFEENAPLFLCS
jgi:hypothetical protein